MKKIFIFFVIMFLSFNSLIAQATDDQIRQAANTLGVPYADLRQFVLSYQNNTSTADVIVIDDVTLHQAYGSNQVRADALYRGKTLRITGIIYRVNRDHVLLRRSGMSSGGVEVYFRSNEIPKIANLEVGQTVTFIGTSDGGTSMYVRVINATLVSE
jgi:hypothetical protein